jgi:hypothetical protein
MAEADAVEDAGDRPPNADSQNDDP